MLKGRLIARSLDWGGVEWSVYGVGKGFSNRSGGEIPSFRVTMKGYNYEELERQAERMAEKLLLHKRIQKVNTNERLSWNERSSSELVLQLPADYLAAGGFTPAELATILRDLGPSQRAEKMISLDGAFYPVHIGSIEGDDFSRYHLQNKRLENQDGRSLQLLGFSELNLQRTSNAIHKENRQYIRLVGFEYFGSHKFGSEYLDEVLAEMVQEMPLGYEAKKMSWQWTWDKVKRQYGLLFLLLVGIFMICAILFESLRQPFFIILTVPLSFIGLFVTFAWFDFYFDQGGYAAFILLGGLVVNASIFILNDFNTIRQINPHKALLKAVAGKTSPILLTVLSTCFGLIPFLLEGQNEVFWFSLAAGTIGGLLFSLFAVFVFLPVVLLDKSRATS
jgi:multidrug efflux pump subunit AcrB